uniref:Uncharacterized protein n=1 Tax=Plectus sambesii TaxID=2011161 RepID=A0A914UZK2_9BILA
MPSSITAVAGLIRLLNCVTLNANAGSRGVLRESDADARRGGSRRPGRAGRVRSHVFLVWWCVCPSGLGDGQRRSLSPLSVATRMRWSAPGPDISAGFPFFLLWPLSLSRSTTFSILCSFDDPVVCISTACCGQIILRKTVAEAEAVEGRGCVAVDGAKEAEEATQCSGESLGLKVEGTLCQSRCDLPVPAAFYPRALM